MAEWNNEVIIASTVVHNVHDAINRKKFHLQEFVKTSNDLSYSVNSTFTFKASIIS